MGLPPPDCADPEKHQGGHPVVPLQCWTEDFPRDRRSSERSTILELDWETQARLNGRLGMFVHSPPFQNVTLIVIVLNGLWIGIDVEWNHFNLKENGKLPLDPTSTVVENIFCTYFTLELVLRFMAFKEKSHCCQDSWFFFDLALVILMVLETWVLVIVEAIAGGGGDGFLSKFSALRLLRLTRLSRLFKSLPELLTLIKGMINAAKAVATVLCFMVLIMYVFAIVFTVSIGDSKAPELKLDPYWDTGSDPTSIDLFGSIGDSMMTLFTRGVLGDNLAETLEAIKDRGGKDADCTSNGGVIESCERTGGNVWLMWIFIIFMIISAFCLFNMIVGILCAVIDETAREESETKNVDAVRNSMSEVFTKIDTSGDGLVTKIEFEQMVQDDSVRNSLVRIGLPEEGMDEELSKIQENLFAEADLQADLQVCGTEVSTDGEVLRVPSKLSRKETGLDLNEFLDKVVDKRFDQTASTLDVARLHAKVQRDEVAFNSQLERIEAMLATVKQNPTRRTQPHVSLTTQTAKSGRVVTGGEPKSGVQPHSNAVWLQGIPTEALFSALERRARQQPAPVAEVD